MLSRFLPVLPALQRQLEQAWPCGLVALVCWLSIVLAIDPAGSYPTMPEGPGLTVDEIFNVEQGVYLFEMSRALGWLNLVPGTSQEAFRREMGYYNPDHPPLGRWWLGLHHQLAAWIAPPDHPDGPIITACARTGSATAFALTVFIVGLFTKRRWGRLAGVLAALALVLMPRVYGHAHLAALETVTNFTCTAAVLAVATWWGSSKSAHWKWATLAGVCWGFALLTKVQAILIPIPVVLWAIWHWRTRALAPLLLWGLTGGVIFFAGWPYLWFDPVGNTAEYLGRTTRRAVVSVWYFGQQYEDRDVPWHYPCVMFALTAPVLLHACGIKEVISRWMTRQQHDGAANTSEEARVDVDGLLLGCAFFPLLVFSWPGVAVYDGERLFLTSFPLWAIFIGRGAAGVWKSIRLRKIAAPVVAGVFGLWQFGNLFVSCPCQLCYYNEIVAFLGGAHRIGLEIDYWGDGITRELLRSAVEQIPPQTRVALVPTLHQFQAADLERQSPLLRARQIHVTELTDPPPEFVLVFERLADLPSSVRIPSPEWEVLARTQGAYLVRRRK